jgi:hypothetical protein
MTKNDLFRDLFSPFAFEFWNKSKTIVGSGEKFKSKQAEACST